MIKAFHDGEKFLSDEVQKFSGSRKVKILDVGCGNGMVTVKVVQNLIDPDVYGIDMVEDQQVDPTIKYTRSDLAKLFPYEDNYFDIVISNQVIEHILNKDAFLSECYRVLKKDGIFLCCTDNISSWDNIISLLLGQEPMSQHTGSRFVTNSFLSPYFMDRINDNSGNLYSHKNVCSYYGLQRLLKIAGFGIIGLRTYGNISKILELVMPIYNRIICIKAKK